MSTPPPRYDDWLAFIFGRTTDESDPFQMDWTFDAPPADLAELVIYTFENCGRDLAPFTDRQVALGFQAILFGDFSGIPHNLIGEKVSDPRKVALLHSLQALYRDCLAKRTPPVLGHRNETANNPLEYVTYMLWDVSPIEYIARSKKDGPEPKAFLEILEAALASGNRACVESALHGLGHARQSGLGAALYNDAIEAIIDRFLATGPEPALRDYALAARTGCIQ